MKTLVSILLTGCMLAANTSSAQQSQEKMLPVVTITASGASVSESVHKAFKRSFRNAENARWYDANKNFLVKFIQDDQQHNVLYRKNGRQIYHIRYGYERNLPQILRHQIKSQYYDYTIGRVFNVVQDQREIWLVNLENTDYMIIAGLEDRQLKEVSKLKNMSAGLVSADIKQ